MLAELLIFVETELVIVRPETVAACVACLAELLLRFESISGVNWLILFLQLLMRADQRRRSGEWVEFGCSGAASLRCRLGAQNGVHRAAFKNMLFGVTVSLPHTVHLRVNSTATPSSRQ